MKIITENTIRMSKLDDSHSPVVKTNQFGRTVLYFDVKYNGKSAKLAVEGDTLATKFAETLSGIDLANDDEIVCTGKVNEYKGTTFINVKEYYGNYVRVAKAGAKDDHAGKIYVQGYYRTK